jgi:hypothetical protein
MNLLLQMKFAPLSPTLSPLRGEGEESARWGC